MIKIISGFSSMGGSTEAFINLTNSLNEKGYETCFYGPHEYHLDKCNSKLIKEISFKGSDIFICHYTKDIPFIGKKKIFSCHERKNFFNLNDIVDELDVVHFVSEQQKNEHSLNIDSFVLPNIIQDIKIIDKPNIKVGGIIGTIFPTKNTHVSILEALKDGCEKVLIYGNIGHENYFKEYILPLVDNKKVFYCGWVIDKSKIYSSLTDVYHYSQTETWGYIEGECYVTGTNFHKSENLKNFSFMKNEDIINKWINIINI